MKKLLTALAASLGVLALPAAANAQVTPYIEATASTQRVERGIDFRNDITYGGRVGVEMPLSGAFSVTADGGIENFLNGNDNLTLTGNLGLVARLVGPFDIYGQAGVLQNAGETGYRLGGGARMRLTNSSYLRAGYQRDSYADRVDAGAGTVALGLRF